MVVVELLDFHHELLYQCITTSMLKAFFQVDVLVPFSILSLSQAPAWWKEGPDKRNYGPWSSECIKTDPEARNFLKFWNAFSCWQSSCHTIPLPCGWWSHSASVPCKEKYGRNSVDLGKFNVPALFLEINRVSANASTKTVILGTSFHICLPFQNEPSYLMCLNNTVY